MFGGLSYLNNGRVKNYGGEIAASTGTVKDLTQDPYGIVWAATTNGLWRFQDAAWRYLGAEWNAPSGSVGRMAFDRTGTLWVMAGKKMLFPRPRRKQFRGGTKNLPPPGFPPGPPPKNLTNQPTPQPPKTLTVH